MTRIILFLCAAVLQSGLFAQQELFTVYFDTDRSDVTGSEQQKFDKFMQSLELDDLSMVIVEGFCDDRGSIGYNQALSERRVNTVIELLVNAGIQSRTISGSGRGELALRGDKAASVERQNNRRVDIQFEFEPPEDPVTQQDDPTDDPISDPEDYTTMDDMDDLQVGDKIILQNILFQGGRHFLLEESYAALDEVTTKLVENTKYQFTVIGHVCCTPYGEDGLDMDTGLMNLSEARAEVIYLYLIDAGVDPDRMDHIGYGGNFPLGGEDKYDRRVEIEITGIIE